MAIVPAGNHKVPSGWPRTGNLEFNQVGRLGLGLAVAAASAGCAGSKLR